MNQEENMPEWTKYKLIIFLYFECLWKKIPFNKK